jgi:hypothetical protein
MRNAAATASATKLTNIRTECLVRAFIFSPPGTVVQTSANTAPEYHLSEPLHPTVSIQWITQCWITCGDPQPPMPSVYVGVNAAMRVGLLEEMETGNSRVSVTGTPALAAACGVAADPLLGRCQANPTSMTPMHIRPTPSTITATKPRLHNSPPLFGAGPQKVTDNAVADGVLRQVEQSAV